MKKLLMIITVFALLLCSGCSEEPEVTESSSESSSNQIIITPAESSESSSEETSSKTENEISSEPESSEVQPEENSSEAEIPPAPEIPEPEDSSVLILVNPWNYIPEGYVPELEKVQGKYNMDIKAAESARNLVAAAKEAGFNMQLCSAYRTVEKSAQLYKNKVNEYIGYGYSEADAKVEAAKWVAPPGTSEHHTGLAMDLVSSDYWNYYSDLEHDYEKFDSFKWMYEHCAEFGFILRYPKDKQDITGITYEPWHYRFVGVEAATYIMENGLCLEEYLEIIGK